MLLFPNGIAGRSELSLKELFGDCHVKKCQSELEIRNPYSYKKEEQ